MRLIFNKAFYKIIGMLTLVEGIALIPCFIVSIYQDGQRISSYLFSLSVTFICMGLMIVMILKSYKVRLKTHEGYFISTICWIYCSLLGAVPFYFCGDNCTVIQSIFESTAGFTTTGCTAFDLALMPKSLLLWRAIENWLGGMGILVLVVSVLPALGVSGQSIASTEATGPTLEKVAGRFSDTAKFLYITYIGFTIIEFVLLSLSPLSTFDALINTFSSISTGGLLVTDSNEALLSLPYARTVIIIFTLIASMNYTLYYYLFNGRKKALSGNAEVRAFWKIIGLSTILITADLMIQGNYNNIILAFKDSISQVISFVSTSGYYVCDYEEWPMFSIIILFILLLIGGCSMSTSGSLKVIRVIILLKLVFRTIFKQIHPHAVKAIKIDGVAIPAEKVSQITSHIITYFSVAAGASVLLALDGLDMETTFTTVIGIFSNTGMAFGEIGSSGSFMAFGNGSLLLLCILMIMGRLEINAVLMLFSKAFWREDKAYQI